MDLNLPDGLGDQFALKLREMPATKNTKVVIVSGWHDLEERAKVLGAAGWIKIHRIISI